MRSPRRATRRAAAAAVAFTSVFLLATCDLDKITGSKADGGSATTIDSTELTLSATGITLGSIILGQSSTMSITSATADLSGVTKRYYSSSSSIISIDSVTGLMTAIGLGGAKITAKIVAPELGDGVTRSQQFTVAFKNIRIQTPTAADSIPGLLQTRNVTVLGTNFTDQLQVGAVALDSLKSRDATIVSVSGATLTARKGGTVKIDAFFRGLRDSVSVRVRQVAKSITFPTTNYVARHMNFNVVVPMTVKDVADSVIPSPTVSTCRVAGNNGTGLPDTTKVVVGLTGSTCFLRVKQVDTTFFVFAKVDTVERGQRITVSQVVGSLTKIFGDARSDTVARNVTVIPTVQAVDSGNTIVKGATVIFKATQGALATAGDTLQVTDTLGRARPTSWKLADVADTNRLTATSGNAAVTFKVVGIAGRAFKLAFSAQPGSAAIGGTINPGVGNGIKVAVLDSLNNLVTGAVTTVTLAFSNNPSAATLNGTLSTNTVAGIATFSNISVSAGGAGYTLQATASGVNSAISNAFDAYGTATKLGFLSVPGSGTVISVPVSPPIRVAVQDVNGATVASATNSITLTFTGPVGGTLGCTCTVAATNGVASFTPTFNTSGSWTGNAAATGLTGATSSAFTVSAIGTANKLEFGVQPSNANAGSSINPGITVRILDANGALVPTASNQVILSIDPTTGTSGAALAGTSAFASSGVATFNSTSINRSGVGYKLIASSGTLTAATSTAFNINTGTAIKLGFVQQPTNTVAGQSMSPGVQVEVQDASGNRVTTGANFNVALTLGGCTGATLTGGGAATTSAGVVSFNSLSIATQVSNCTLTAAATSLTSAVSTTFSSISATGPQRLRFTTQPTTPGTATSSSQFGGTVNIADPNGNNVSSTSSVAITLSVLSGPSTTIGGTTTNNTTSSTSFSFLSFATAGTYRLLASAPGFRPDTSQNLVINPGTATKLGFTVQPSNQFAGVPFSPAVTVAVQDANGNTVTSSSNAIQLSTSNGFGFGSGTTVTLNATNGVATFTGLTVKKATSSMFLTATNVSLSSAFSNNFSITAAPLSTLGFSTQPTTATAGQTFPTTVVVQAQDSVGNAVTDFTQAITLALSGGPVGAVLSGTKTVTATSGSASFPGLSIDKSATNYQLVASSSGLTNGSSNTFTVNAGTATKLGWLTQPTATFINAPLVPPSSPAQVAVQDALGNTVTNNFSTVQITVATGPTPNFKSNGSTTISQNISVSSGIASLTQSLISMLQTGTYTLSATSFNGYTAATSNAFSVAANDVKAKLFWSVQPSNGTYGARFSTTPVVTVADLYDNTVPNATDAVTVALGVDGNPVTTLSGGGSTAAVSGLAQFPALSLNKAGTGYTLVASASGLTSGTSNSFTVTSPGLLATSVNTNDQVLLNGTIYFMHGTNVKSVSSTGGTVTTITGVSGVASRITTDGTNIYWTETGPSNNGDALVRKLTVGTSGISTLASGLTQVSVNNSRIATDGVNVYFVGRNVAGTALAVKSISVNANDGTPSDIVSTGSTGQTPYFTVGGGFIYYNLDATGTINRVPTSGGAPTQIATLASFAQNLALDGTTLYWTNGAGELKSVPNANTQSAAQTPAHHLSTSTTVYDLQINAGNLYVQVGNVGRKYLIGSFGSFTTMASNFDQSIYRPTLFDSVDLYYIDSSSRIAKIPK